MIRIRAEHETGVEHDAFRVRSFQGGAVTAVDARSGRCFTRHWHDQFGVGLLTHGAQRSWSGRGAVEAVSGDLITVNPAELHDGAPVGAARCWSMLYLSEALVGAAVADLEEGRRPVREFEAPVVTNPGLARLFIATRRAALEPRAGAAFEERLLVLLGGLLGIVATTSPAAIRGIRRLRERIDDAPTQAHSLADLAAEAGMSRFQVLRAFARLTGMTPHRYVLQRRLDVARRLIRHGSSVAGAAAEAGFSDQSHLHRAFVARHGFTPGAYAASFPAIASKRRPTQDR